MDENTPPALVSPDSSDLDGSVLDHDAGKPRVRNRGQSLVAEYRAARLRQRPALQVELRNDRLSLREQRAVALARKPSALKPTAPVETASHGGVQGADYTTEPVPAIFSVFAQFVDLAQERPIAAAVPAEPAPVPDVTEAQPLMGNYTAPDTAQKPEPVLEILTPPVPDVRPAAGGPTLAAVGFGPGMVIRFGQLGIETAADLAAADEASLRAALGDISRLVNVKVWIDSARRTCADAG